MRSHYGQAGHPGQRRTSAQRGRGATWFVLILIVGCHFVAIRQIDAVLRRMSAIGGEQGSGLSFPLDPRRVVDFRHSWMRYGRDDLVGSTASVQPPEVLHWWLLVLGIPFSVLSLMLLGLLRESVRALMEAEHAERPEDAGVRVRLREGFETWLRWAFRLLYPVVIIELILLYLAYGADLPCDLRSRGGAQLSCDLMVGGLGWVGWAVTLVKWVLLATVLGTLTVNAASVCWRWWKTEPLPLRKAIACTRGLLVVVAIMIMLMLVLPIGVRQIDDVVRAWSSWGPACFALAATCFAAWVVLGAVQELTDTTTENLQGEVGKDSQRVLIGGAVLIGVVGVIVAGFGYGWGLLVPAVLLLGIGLAGWFVTPAERPGSGGGGERPGHADATMRAQPDRRVSAPGVTAAVWRVSWVLGAMAVLSLVGALARVGRNPGTEVRSAHVQAPARSIGRPPVPGAGSEGGYVGRMLTAKARSALAWALAPPKPCDMGPEVAAAGRRVGRILGAAVCLTLVWTLARGAAFDLLVRSEPLRREWLVKLLVIACAAIAIGFLIVRIDQRHNRAIRLSWMVLSALSLLVLLDTFLMDQHAILWPLALGSVAVLMIGVSAAAGVVTAVIVLLRRIGCRHYQLPRIFLLMNLKRFPAIAFVLVWVLVVAAVDPGGFHDIRHVKASGSAPAPTLERAYQAWRAAQPATGPRPLIFVAAQGGGIRAAVWTALVMECVFGPTPMLDANNICAGNVRTAGTLGDRVRREALPVFVASGASGGSVGLAAWSARRVDLAEPDGTVKGIPKHIDDVLDDDYVAPDIARLLSGDALYLFAAHRQPDRAAMLEHSWEHSWGEPVGGLSRGMRAAYALANVADGGQAKWRMPLLVMNGSQVEDGCRFVSSPVDLVLPRDPGVKLAENVDRADDATCGTGAGATDPNVVDALPRTNELIDYLCPEQDVPLSTAAHLSARFPYVSPIARVPAGDCSGSGYMPSGAVSYVTDGGMTDNSGASTAAQLWRALQPEVAASESPGSCVIPFFLQIDNSVADESGNTSTAPPFELIGPGQALLNRVSGQEAAERAEARQEFAAIRTADGQLLDNESAWFRIAPSVQPGTEPPLGWTLAPATVTDMRQQMLSGNNGRSLLRLRQLLAAPPRCPT
jgi:hypothetical protein